MKFNDNEVWISLSNRLGYNANFLNNFEIQQTLSRGVDENGIWYIKYDHLPHIPNPPIQSNEYFLVLYQAIQKLLTTFNINPEVADDLMVICSSYSYFDLVSLVRLQVDKSIMDNAKLLVKLLLVPFPDEKETDLDDMNDETILHYLQDIRRDKATKYIKNGYLDRSLIEPEYFSILSKLERGIKINLESKDVKGKDKFYYILFSRLITTSFTVPSSRGNQTIQLTGGQNHSILRIFLKELLSEQARYNKDFFKVIRDPLFNNNREKLLRPFINGRISKTHNQILKQITPLIANYLTENNFILKPKRRGIMTEDMKVFTYYLYSLQSLLLINKQPHIKTEKELHEIVIEFTSLTIKDRFKIASKLNEIIKNGDELKARRPDSEP